jgi:hypothetical protein
MVEETCRRAKVHATQKAGRQRIVRRSSSCEAVLRGAACERRAAEAKTLIASKERVSSGCEAWWELTSGAQPLEMPSGDRNRALHLPDPQSRLRAPSP